MRFEFFANAASYPAGFGESRLVDICVAGRAPVSNISVDYGKVVELFQRLPYLGFDLTILDYRPENKERDGVAWNQNALIQGFHFILNRIEWWPKSVQRTGQTHLNF